MAIEAERASQANGSLRKIISTLQIDKNDAQRQLAEKNDALKNLLLKFQEQEKEKTHGTLKFEKTQSRLSALQNEIEPLRRKEEKDRTDMESLNNNIQKLQSQNETLSKYLAGADSNMEEVFRIAQGHKRTREAEQKQDAAAKRTKTS